MDVSAALGAHPQPAELVQPSQGSLHHPAVHSQPAAVFGVPPGQGGRNMTRPLCPPKNSQSANPAALAMAFTRRTICESGSPNTFSPPPTPAGGIASSVFMAAGVMATTALTACTSVLERMTMMRPLPSSQRWTSPQMRDAASDRRRPA